MYFQWVSLQWKILENLCANFLKDIILIEQKAIKELLHGSLFAFAVLLPKTWSTVQPPSDSYQRAEYSFIPDMKKGKLNCN